MNKDSALLEQAYLKIYKEMYYGSYDDREDPHHSYSEGLSFFVESVAGNRDYIIHFYCDYAEISGNPNTGKNNLDYKFDKEEILVWDVVKTPEILKFFKESEEKGRHFVDNLTDEIINAALINYPSKNRDFIKKYKNNPVYGVLIKDAYGTAEDYLYDGFVSD
jgi:hypothetical protein